MSGKTISVQSMVSRSDYNVLRNYHMYKKNLKRTRITVYILLASLVLLFISETAFTLPFLRLLGFIGILIVAIIYAWLSLDARKLEKIAKGIINKKQEILLSESGFSVKWTGLEQSQYRWEEVDHVVENDSHFFLFLDEYFVIIIPKLVLKEYRVSEIHNFLKNHVTLISDMSGWKPQGI